MTRRHHGFGFELSRSADHLTATLCTPHDSVYKPGPHAGKSENGFFGSLRSKGFRLVLEQKTTTFLVVILDSKYSKMTPKLVKQKSH